MNPQRIVAKEYHKDPTRIATPSPARPRPAAGATAYAPIYPPKIALRPEERHSDWISHVRLIAARPPKPAASGLGVLKSHRRIAEAHLKGRVALATPYPARTKRAAPATGSALTSHLKTAKERASDWIPVARSTHAQPAKPAASSISSSVSTLRRNGALRSVASPKAPVLPAPKFRAERPKHAAPQTGHATRRFRARARSITPVRPRGQAAPVSPTHAGIRHAARATAPVPTCRQKSVFRPRGRPWDSAPSVRLTAARLVRPAATRSSVAMTHWWEIARAYQRDRVARARPFHVRQRHAALATAPVWSCPRWIVS